MVVLLVVVMLIAGATPLRPGHAQQDDPKGNLDALQQEMTARAREETALDAAARALHKELDGLRGEMIAAATAAQAREEELSVLEAQVQALNTQLERKKAALLSQRGRLAAVLGSLQRIALAPSGALIAMPGRPVDTLRGAILLRAAIPAIEDEARILRGELDILARLGTDIAVRRQEIAGVAADLGRARDRLETLFARKRALLEETEGQRKAASAQVARLAERAQTLRDLLRKLEARAAMVPPLRKPPQPGAEGSPSQGAISAPGSTPAALPAARLTRPAGLREFAEAKGQVVLPARGKTAGRFGETTDFGVTRKGIVILTRPDAQVIAPFDGQVVFAGPFRGYGQILIIEHGGGYHTLVAGLARVDAIVGQWVLAGEPVGLMGNLDAEQTELYVELRRGGQPVDPSPWFAQRG
ncbi:MAG: peptidoglycan DD-metalloendopeptidase family protein [Rhodospirillaceae bacterium]|nr:peptidoglycan DD-metalloendopeptidase family protein [Rhodospirillaceae bacterium]MBT6116270.1 peptidoglycan DD-metalloendopeptidase family protein [Rhodospirillaceae bacterium]